jgi:hypothetical protein
LSNLWCKGCMISPTGLKTQDRQWLLFHPVGKCPFKFTNFQLEVLPKYEKFSGYWQRGIPFLMEGNYL